MSDITPSEKRLNFARTLLSERPGFAEPAGWESDYRITSKFIDDMLKVKGNGAGGGGGGGPRPPTDKQLNFARTLLSERPGFEEPEGWDQTAAACSAFIDELMKIKVPRK